MWRLVWGEKGRGMARVRGRRVGDEGESSEEAWVVIWGLFIMRGIVESNGEKQ